MYFSLAGMMKRKQKESIENSHILLMKFSTDYFSSASTVSPLQPLLRIASAMAESFSKR